MVDLDQMALVNWNRLLTVPPVTLPALGNDSPGLQRLKGTGTTGCPKLGLKLTSSVGSLVFIAFECALSLDRRFAALGHVGLHLKAGLHRLAGLGIDSGLSENIVLNL